MKIPLKKTRLKIAPIKLHPDLSETNELTQWGGNKTGNSLPSTHQSWWHHQKETFSVLLSICEGNPLVTNGFPLQRPVTGSFDVFFYLHLSIQLCKQSRRRSFEISSCSLRRHCYVSGQQQAKSWFHHYSEVIISEMASPITSVWIIYSTIYLGADQGKHQSSASLALVRGIHQWLVNSPGRASNMENVFISWHHYD